MSTAAKKVLDQRDKLRGFARAVMESWPEGDVDGGDLQEMALKFGLLEKRTVSEPCGEACSCAEFYSTDEFPVECNFKTPLLTGKEPV